MDFFNTLPPPPRPREIDYRFEGYYRIELNGNDVEDLPYNVDTENHGQFMAKLINIINCNSNALRRYCGWFRLFLVKNGEEEPISLLMRKFNLYINAVHNGKKLFELGHKSEGAKFFFDVDFTGYGVTYRDLFGTSWLVGIELGYRQVSISADVIYNNRHEPYKWKRAIGILVLTFPESARFVWIDEDVTLAIEEERVITLTREGEYSYITKLPFYWGDASEVAREERPYPWERHLDWYQPNKKTIHGIRTLLISVRYAKAALHIHTMSKRPPTGYCRSGPRGGGGGGDGDGDGRGNRGPETRHSGGRDGGSKPRFKRRFGSENSDGNTGTNNSYKRYKRFKSGVNEGAVTVNTPVITASDCEGAGEMFHFTTLNDAEKLEKELIKNPPSSQEDGDVAWKLRGLAQMRKVDDSMARAMRVTSSPQEWRERGKKFFYENNFGMAIICFERAGDTMWEKMAKASDLRASADQMRRTNHEAFLGYVRDAAEIFESVGKFESAASCYCDLGEYERAGKIYLCTGGKTDAAAECFSLAGCYSEAAEAYAKGYQFSNCLSVCKEGKLFNKGLEYIIYWKESITVRNKDVQQIELEFLKSCAFEYHELNHPKSMMKFVHAFYSVESKRVFLRSLGCLSDLLLLEEELGQFLEAAELARSLGDGIKEADLKSDGSNVERSGAAQGLSEVVAALGTEYFEHLLPDIIRNCSHPKAPVRDGYLTLFKYLPRSLGVQFQNYLQQVLPSILDGLADENESVREAALGAGHILVEHYAISSLPLLLPAVEDGIFNDNWRIRQSSVELLGDLLFKVAGTSGKALLEGGSDDEGASTEAQGRAIIEVLGRDKRNEVLAALYMVWTDISLSVRQAALHVWKTIVVNTPKTLKEIMPVLMNTLIASLASPSSERRQAAGRALGELVRKLGERVLPLVIPILSKGLKDPDSSRRQGVCIGLSEVMASAGRSQLLSFMDELIPTIRTALCDSEVEVRESAGVAFSTLYKSAGMQAIDEIVPTLLHALEDDDMADTALDGLKQILSVRTAAVLPHILPKLVHLPLSAFNAHALGAVAEVAGAGLNVHLSTVLPALLSAMGDDDHVDVQNLAKKAAETVVLVIDDEGIEYMISELLKGVGDSQASTRRSSAYLIGYFFKNSKLYLVDEAPTMISTLIVLLSDTDSATVLAAWEALARVVSSVPKEVLPSYIKLVRDAVSTSRDKERRKKKGGPIVIPGLCLPKALQPLLPIYLQGLISGSPEVREQAAQGLGELIEVTSEKALKEFVIPITGPLIRIIGDRFPWQVKSAILSTLTIIIAKGGMALKPFLPQLQTTFVKCLQDSTRTVRSSAASALGKLSALSTRVDPLVGDLLSNLQASDGGVREAILAALKGVVKHAGKSVSAPVKTRVYDLLKEMIYNDDDQIRSSSARILGIISEYLEEDQISELLEELPEKASSPSWSARHGSVLTISSMLRHIPTVMSASPLFTAVSDCLKNSLKDEKFPVRETSTKALGRLLLHQIQKDPSNTNAHKGTVVSIASAMQDDSSEVRRRALFALKAVSKANPSVVMIHVTVYGPALAECLKDGSTPVRLAAERCALHALQLTKGTENVQSAQKYITGLDARRISKLSEYSDDSDDSEDDSASG